MKKAILFSVLLSAGNLVTGQTISSKKWSDLFSYNNVLAIKEDNGKLVAATENGIFYYNLSSGEITKLSKANGLHEVKISAFDYNPQTGIGLVGYRNGSMDVITPGGITYVVDIPIATGYNGDKRINHISITGDRAVISVGYGVSIFDLKKKEFAQSAFFTTGTGFEAANEATIKDNTVYAATATGLKTHEIDVTFPVYSTWNTQTAGNFIHADSENTTVYATANNVYYGNGTAFSQLTQAFGKISDVVVTEQHITVTDNERIYVFTTGGAAVNSAGFAQPCNTGTYIGGQVFAGTQRSGIMNAAKSSIKPDGPFNNRSYKIEIRNNKLWVSSGARKDRYNGSQPDPANLGFYHFDGMQWVYPTMFIDNTDTVYNVMDVVANPADTDEVFFANHTEKPGQGIYRMKYEASSKDFSLQKFYPTSTNHSYNRPTGLAFDGNNNLMGTIGFLFNDATNSFSAGIMAYDRAADSFLTRNLPVSFSTQKPVFYGDLMWIPLPRTTDLMAYDYKNSPLNFSDDVPYNITDQNGLPTNSEGTISIAFDKNDDAWIGTDTGLRILPSAPTEVKNSPQLEPVIIEQNGIPEELFRDGAILQVEVDSGNYKWVSVDGGGAYLLSANGERTLLQFTRENSPIPTNSITDIKVDNRTGKVYFVTFDGIVVYQGDVVDVTSNFGNVVVYPNPVVTANFKGFVTIRGLAERTNIRIVDAAGNLVHQAVARGGFHQWDLNNQRGKRVASGVYFVLMTNADGTDKATAKIAVVN